MLLCVEMSDTDAGKSLAAPVLPESMGGMRHGSVRLANTHHSPLDECGAGRQHGGQSQHHSPCQHPHGRKDDDDVQLARRQARLPTPPVRRHRTRARQAVLKRPAVPPSPFAWLLAASLFEAESLFSCCICHIWQRHCLRSLKPAAWTVSET